MVAAIKEMMVAKRKTSKAPSTSHYVSEHFHRAFGDGRECFLTDGRLGNVVINEKLRVKTKPTR